MAASANAFGIRGRSDNRKSPTVGLVREQYQLNNGDAMSLTTHRNMMEANATIPDGTVTGQIVSFANDGTQHTITGKFNDQGTSTTLTVPANGTGLLIWVGGGWRVLLGVASMLSVS